MLTRLTPTRALVEFVASFAVGVGWAEMPIAIGWAIGGAVVSILAVVLAFDLARVYASRSS